MGPTGLVGWGSIGSHSIPSKQPRNPSPVSPTYPHEIRCGAQLGLLAGAQVGPTPYPVNSPETQVQFSPRINTISNVGPTGLVGWGSIGAHSIPSKQPRNPGQVYPTNPHNIRRGAQQGLLAEAQLGPTPYPANSPETQAQFSPHIHAISDVGPNWAC